MVVANKRRKDIIYGVARYLPRPFRRLLASKLKTISIESLVRIEQPLQNGIYKRSWTRNRRLALSVETASIGKSEICR